MTPAGRRSLSTPLDRRFAPYALSWRRHQAEISGRGETGVLAVALEREHGLVSRYEFALLPEDHPDLEDSLALVERAVKFLLWSRGAGTLHVVAVGPAARRLAERIRVAYAPGGARDFDRELLGRVYGRDFRVQLVEPDALPAEHEETAAIGGHVDGCRIGFDLGASDYKVAAVIDGEVVFHEETPWDPKVEADPAYHLGHIRAALERAAAHLPRVDAIGGSAAGIYIDDRVRVASLFRSVPESRFVAEVEPMFARLGEEWGVPIRVINDGDVTALAGAMASGCGGILGIAMGSSEAAGYLGHDRRIKGWLNELGFAPVDGGAEAPVEEWSGDRGVGTSYFSQQAIERLAHVAGMELDPALGQAEKLVVVQELAENGDQRAGLLFATIGAYLGHTVPWYRVFYGFDTVLVLGRVTSGAGGDLLVREARRVLEQDYPELADRVALQLPDETTRRVGQAVAAASLPMLAS